VSSKILSFSFRKTRTDSREREELFSYVIVGSFVNCGILCGLYYGLDRSCLCGVSIRNHSYAFSKLASGTQGTFLAVLFVLWLSRLTSLSLACNVQEFKEEALTLVFGKGFRGIEGVQQQQRDNKVRFDNHVQHSDNGDAKIKQGE